MQHSHLYRGGRGVARIQHSHFYRGGQGVARFSILTFIVVAAEWPDAAFSLLSWRPRSGPIQHSHFYRGGRGVARFSILTSNVVAAEWPDSAFSLLSWWPPRTEPCKNPRLLGRRRYVAYDDGDDDDDNGGDYVFLYGGSVCVSVESRNLLNRTNTDLQK